MPCTIWKDFEVHIGRCAGIRFFREQMGILPQIYHLYTWAA